MIRLSIRLASLICVKQAALWEDSSRFVRTAAENRCRAAPTRTAADAGHVAAGTEDDERLEQLGHEQLLPEMPR
jgi:hypothetical protein